MSKIRDIIEKPHWVYKDNIHFWNFLLDSYEGGHVYTNANVAVQNSSGGDLKVYVNGEELRTRYQSNLFKHKKELASDYNERLKMSYYYNFCAPIIDIYTNHLFKQPVLEDWSNIENVVDKRYDNINCQGSSISEFRKELSEITQLYGHSFVVCDSPRMNKEIHSLQDKIDQNAFPYFTIKHPQSVINWALDEFGQPYWVLIEDYRDNNEDPFNYDYNKTSSRSFILWTRNEWVIYNEKYEEVSRGEHRLGIVPITCCYEKRSKRVQAFMGISFLADIAFIARDVYNACSELKQILRDQTFAFLALQGQADEYDETSVGTSKGLLYPSDRNAPQYISPPSDNAKTYFEHIDRQVTKMFQMAKLESGSVSYAGSKVNEQSGVSKAWDFNQTNSALSSKAGNMEDAENKLWRVFAAWEGKEFEGSVTYPNEFSIQSLNDDLDQAEKILKLGMGREFNMEVKKAIVKKKFPRANDEDIERMKNSIESESQTEGRKLSDRLNLFRTPTGGNNGGLNNARSTNNNAVR